MKEPIKDLKELDEMIRQLCSSFEDFELNLWKHTLSFKQ